MIVTCLKKYRKIWPLKFLFFSQGKEKQRRRLFENQTICVNHPLGLMPVNCSLIPCVRVCQQSFIRDETTMKNKKIQGKAKSSLHIWKYAHNKFSSNLTSCKIESYYTRGTHKNLIASVLTVIASIVKRFLGQWDFISISVKKLDQA